MRVKTVNLTRSDDKEWNLYNPKLYTGDSGSSIARLNDAF